MAIIRKNKPACALGELPKVRKAPDNTAHKAMCARAIRWLRNSMGCAVAVSEVVTTVAEIPDAIGWNWGHSILIECKTSRSDFLRDKHKANKRDGRGLGKYRFYMCPPGIIKPEDLPPNWGLLYIKGKVVTRIKAPLGNNPCYDSWQAFEHEYDKLAEMKLLASVIRRLRDNCPYVRGKLA